MLWLVIPYGRHGANHRVLFHDSEVQGLGDCPGVVSRFELRLHGTGQHAFVAEYAQRIESGKCLYALVIR